MLPLPKNELLTVAVKPDGRHGAPLCSSRETQLQSYEVTSSKKSRRGRSKSASWPTSGEPAACRLGSPSNRVKSMEPKSFRMRLHGENLGLLKGIFLRQSFILFHRSSIQHALLLCDPVLWAHCLSGSRAIKDPPNQQARTLAPASNQAIFSCTPRSEGL